MFCFKSIQNLFWFLWKVCLKNPAGDVPFQVIKYFWDYFDPKRLKDEAHAAEAQGPLGSFFGYVAEEVGIWRWSSVRLPQTAKTSL